MGEAVRSRFWRAAGLGGVSVLLLVSSIRPTVAEGPPLDAALFERIDAFLASERQASGIPGLAVVIATGDQVVHTTALGDADRAGRPVTQDTPFVLASLSKAFTATAIMQLAEAGRIDLDAPVQRYLPWFRVADEAASARITIAQLLHHASGLGSPFPTDDGQDAGALERRVRALGSEQLLFEPGSGYNYTDAGYDVLGLVVQTVSGVPFDRYIEERIFGPLGMVHSHVLPADAIADGAAEGFSRWFGLLTMPAQVPQPRGNGPAALIYSSANDIGRWIMANLDGGRMGEARVVTEAGMERLHAPVVESEPDHAYAMGWVVRPYWESLVVAGAPPTDYQLPALVEHGGAAPNGHTYIGLVPERGWGFAVLMNVFDEADPEPYMHVEQGIQRLLAGVDPWPLSLGWDPLGRNARITALVLLLLELVSLVWSVRILHRWRRPAATQPPARRAAATIAAPLLLDLLVLYLLLLYFPERYGPIPAILAYQPDTPLLFWPLLILAGIWGTLRTLALAVLYRARRQARVREAAYAAPR